MFDSPLHFCGSCKHYVALDEGFEECRRQHGCRPESCAVAHLFELPRVAVPGDPRPPELIALAELSR